MCNCQMCYCTNVQQNRVTALFFVSSTIVGGFFLMNLLLAAVCDKYQQEHDRHADAQKSLRDDNAAAAFKLLGKAQAYFTTCTNVRV
jgi:hypothetical protein